MRVLIICFPSLQSLNWFGRWCFLHFTWTSLLIVLGTCFGEWIASFPRSYSLRPILLFVNTDVSRYILVIDTSVLAKSNMGRWEYKNLVLCGAAAICGTIWKTRNDACFHKKFPNDPANVIYRLCNIISGCAILQINQDTWRVEYGLEHLKKVIL
jgi:hypothetical protein